MTPTIVLLTDFGDRDPYVGELKAALIGAWDRAAPDRPAPALLDLCHAVPPGDVATAAWLLRRSAPHLPRGAVVLAVVDPGVGTARGALAAEAGGLRCVAPDNGLLSLLDVATAVELDPSRCGGPAAITPTFHGRDLFAPAAARLAAGAGLAALGTPRALPLTPLPPQDDVGTEILGRVRWLDRFGNALTDIDADSECGRRLDAGATLEIGGTRVAGPRRTYGAAEPGTPFWYWGSGGTLEAALRDGDAAGRYAWTIGMAVRAAAT